MLSVTIDAVRKKIAPGGMMLDAGQITEINGIYKSSPPLLTIFFKIKRLIGV